MLMFMGFFLSSDLRLGNLLNSLHFISYLKVLLPFLGR